MLNEYDLTLMCKEICSQAGYDFNIPIKINKRLTRTLGRVIYTQTTEGKLYNSSMEFSYVMLTTSSLDSIKAVVEHECAHFLVTEETHERHGHDAIFKNMCKKINCLNDTAEFNDIKKTAPDSEIYKYIVVCDKCGTTIGKYFRAGKVVQHPEYYRCKCGGSIRIIYNR